LGLEGAMMKFQIAIEALIEIYLYMYKEGIFFLKKYKTYGPRLENGKFMPERKWIYAPSKAS